MSWQLLEDQQPNLAAFGAERLNGCVAYLATVRKDGSPRVHPVTPIIGQGHLFVFMEPTSPNGMTSSEMGATPWIVPSPMAVAPAVSLASLAGRI